MIPNKEKDYFFETLNQGRYNLLLGAGVSLDSTNIKNQTMQSGETLRTTLINLLKANSNTSMSKLISNLDVNQKDEYLQKAFSVSKIGESLKNINKYVWRNIFTFNMTLLQRYDLIPRTSTGHPTNQLCTKPASLNRNTHSTAYNSVVPLSPDF